MVTSMWLITATILLYCSQSNAQEYLQPERDAQFVFNCDSDSIVIQSGDSLYDTIQLLSMYRVLLTA